MCIEFIIDIARNSMGVFELWVDIFTPVYCPRCWGYVFIYSSEVRPVVSCRWRCDTMSHSSRLVPAGSEVLVENTAKSQPLDRYGQAPVL